MPPHCDSMDGPVVKASIKALDTGNVEEILPFVPEEDEAEITRAFDKVVRARVHGPEAMEVADKYFFETVVRVHRAGEGAPYTGLKPAGLGHGSVIPVAERAIETGSPDELVELLTGTVEAEIRKRFAHAMYLKSRAAESVGDAREYVEAMLGLQVYAHGLQECAQVGPHGAAHQHAA